ncbi:MAG: DUF1501 domain-containing protein [Planctomycetota bacterium]|nr:DUF1501 domain-containing protein [Planctomycetota bacterium]MDA1213374.1 DUF1501 domain-containing protein [Planctomycetota bacterium]
MNVDDRFHAEEHRLSRRSVLGALMGGAAGLLAPRSSLLRAEEDVPGRKVGKRLLIVFQTGGLSQLESWDLKPNTNTGGPCLPIQTSVPGLTISEWLPHSAKIMHHLTLLRGMSTGNNDHGPAAYMMISGRREGEALVYPHMGCVTTRYLTPADHPVPGFVSIEGYDGSESAFLGTKYSPIKVKIDTPPSHLDLPPQVTPLAEQRRQDFRRKLDRRFGEKRSEAKTTAYMQTFEQAQQLMRNKSMFDRSGEDPKQLDRYGRNAMGEKCLMALRLLEQGVTCVQVGHPGYDTHAENFNVHWDLLEQFDRAFACLIDDLVMRGLLDDTVVVCTGEFGRTPTINHRMGRDHWSHSWSNIVAGAGFARGGVYGKTSDDGNEVIDGKINAAQFFHTLLTSLGIDSEQSYIVDGQQIPIADPAVEPVKELLS